ncbi:MAG: amidohydrolase family protein [Bryobacteraceae bacterium]|nr:amidohydrolase family protein [Bryobacteraceae bacterium]
MRKGKLAALLGVLSLAPAAFAQIIAFENVNIVPMDRERVVETQTVIIRDGRIAQIGPANRVQAPEGAERINASGKYLMPGLAEMHGHLPSSDAPRSLVEHFLFLYIANGVTTVRGMQGNPIALQIREDVNTGKLPGPRLYVAGPPFGGNVRTPEIAEKMVREQKAAGYDLLKISEGMGPEAYDAVARTARELQIDFAGHVPNDVGVRRVIQARQRSIDHLDNYIEGLESETSPLRSQDPKVRARDLPFHVDESKIEELVRLTREAGVWNMPTMACWENFYSADDGEKLRSSIPEVRYMPRSAVDNWVKGKNSLLRPDGGPFLGFLVGGKTGPRVMDLRRKILRALHEGGAKIALGTDSPQIFSVPGFSIHREMPLMAQCGMKPFDILRTGTRNVAEYFGTLEETGTVEQGKRADLILLEANPLEDVTNVRRRAGVVVNGRWMAESEIQKRLSELAAAAEKM